MQGLLVGLVVVQRKVGLCTGPVVLAPTTMVFLSQYRSSSGACEPRVGDDGSVPWESPSEDGQLSQESVPFICRVG